MTDRIPEAITRGDIITVATLSFTAGLLLGTATYYITKGDSMAWLFAVSAVVAMCAAFTVSRRTLRKIS